MDKKSLVQKLYSALSVLKHKTAQQGSIQYIKVNNIEEIILPF